MSSTHCFSHIFFLWSLSILALHLSLRFFPSPTFPSLSYLSSLFPLLIFCVFTTSTVNSLSELVSQQCFEMLRDQFEVHEQNQKKPSTLPLGTSPRDNNNNSSNTNNVDLSDDVFDYSDTIDEKVAGILAGGLSASNNKAVKVFTVIFPLSRSFPFLSSPLLPVWMSPKLMFLLMLFCSLPGPIPNFPGKGVPVGAVCWTVADATNRARAHRRATCLHYYRSCKSIHTAVLVLPLTLCGHCCCGWRCCCSCCCHCHCCCPCVHYCGCYCCYF